MVPVRGLKLRQRNYDRGTLSFLQLEFVEWVSGKEELQVALIGFYGWVVAEKRLHECRVVQLLDRAIAEDNYSKVFSMTNVSPPFCCSRASALCACSTRPAIALLAAAIRSPG